VQTIATMDGIFGASTVIAVSHAVAESSHARGIVRVIRGCRIQTLDPVA